MGHVLIPCKKEEALSILPDEKNQKGSVTAESGGVNAMKRIPPSVRMKEEVTAFLRGVEAEGARP